MPDRLRHLTGTLLNQLIIGEIVLGSLFVVFLGLSLPLEGQLAARLLAKYGRRINFTAMTAALRVAAVIGIAGAGILHRMLTALRGVLASVGAGDPFVGDNADRLMRIGWALLGLQLLDLAAGAMVFWFQQLGTETAIWTPSFVGWLGVLLAFVLARVFRRGAEMRDDLAMTV